jgi:hypothetical protein
MDQAGSQMESYYPKVRQALMNAPGLVNISGERGYYPGCRAIILTEGHVPSGMREGELQKLKERLGAGWPSPAVQLNAFFECFGNMTLVSWQVDLGGSYHIFVTTQLEREDLEDLQWAGEQMERLIGEHKAEREKAKADEARLADEKAADERALIELGRKAREHNLLDRLRELAEDNQKLRKAARKGGE